MSRRTLTARSFKPLAAGISAAALAVAALTAVAATSSAAVKTPAAPSAAGPAAAPAALGNNWYAAAPYLMPLDNNPPDAGAVMDASGLKAFQLAFVLAPNGGGCSPTWDGTDAVSSDTQVANVVSADPRQGR